jgi:hypothetical protein
MEAISKTTHGRHTVNRNHPDRNPVTRVHARHPIRAEVAGVTITVGTHASDHRTRHKTLHNIHYQNLAIVRLFCYHGAIPMKKLTLDFTPEELGILTTMASDQLFRKQFIDSKMPGFKPNREELDMCKNLVGRLRAIVDEQRTKTASAIEKKVTTR